MFSLLCAVIVMQFFAQGSASLEGPAMAQAVHLLLFPTRFKKTCLFFRVFPCSTCSLKSQEECRVKSGDNGDKEK